MKENKNNKSDKSRQETPVYLTGDSTLQTPDEDRRDSSIEPAQNVSMEPSKDDIHDINADLSGGGDKADTAKRKKDDLNESNNND